MIAQSQIAKWAEASASADALLRQRARTVFRESGLFQHLPLTGLMLEVGAASAHLVEAVMRRMPYRRCVAADPVQRPLRRLASRMARRDFYALRSTGEYLPFETGRFDAAWASFALHRLSHPAQERVLAEMSRVVRPGGSLILIEDTPTTAWQTAIARWEDRRLRPSPLPTYHYRSPMQWRTTLSSCGWQIREEVAFTSLFPPTTPGRVPRRSFICVRP